MKRFTKALAILMVTALIMSIAAVSASAVDQDATITTPVNFTKYMVVDNEANIPNAEIEFTIVPGAAIAATPTTMAVYAGPTNTVTDNTTTPPTTTTYPKISSVTFGPNDATYTTVQSGDDVTLASGEKYAKQTPAIDFTGVEFPEPGVYRYEIAETDPQIAGMTPDSSTLYLDVYVTSDANNDLTVSSTVLHTSANAPARNSNSGSADVQTNGAGVADKVTGFTNSYATKDLEFSKTVSGNQASRDKYFAFTVTISHATAGDVFDVDYTNADPTITHNPNAATTIAALNGNSDFNQPGVQPNVTPTITVGQGGTVTETFYLHDGQSIKITGLPIDADYSVVEDREDYTPSVAVTGDVDGTNNNANEATNVTDTDAAPIGATGTVDTDDADTISVALTNTKDGVIPTGVLVMITPFAVGILLFGTLMFFMVSKRRRDNY